MMVPGATYQRTLKRLLDSLRDQGIADERVLDAIRQVPRHRFVDEALAARAYENTALPIGHGQTISQPYIVARMTELLMQGRAPDTVLEVGTGSGYQTAVLASLVSRVYTVERIAALTHSAEERLRDMKFRNIRYHYSDGGYGLPEHAPFDAIIVTAAPPGIPRALIQQLLPGGKMILPIGEGESQALVRVTRTREGYEHEIIEPVVFVPLISGRLL